MSEPIAASSNTSAWAIVSPVAGVGATPTAVSVSSNIVNLTISEPTSFDTSTGGMSLAFTTNSNWKDAVNNPVSSNASISLTDAALPQVVSAKTVDIGGYYGAQIVFSEPLLSTTLAGFGLGGTSTFTGTIINLDSLTYNLVTADATALNTGKTFTLTYSNTGLVSDPSGNQLANIASKTVIDNLAPRIISRTTADTNHNGKIDAIVATYSEVLGGSLAGYTPTVTGYTVSGSVLSGSTVTTQLVE